MAIWRHIAVTGSRSSPVAATSHPKELPRARVAVTVRQHRVAVEHHVERDRGVRQLREVLLGQPLYGLEEVDRLMAHGRDVQPRQAEMQPPDATLVDPEELQNLPNSQVKSRVTRCLSRPGA